MRQFQTSYLLDFMFDRVGVIVTIVVLLMFLSTVGTYKIYRLSQECNAAGYPTVKWDPFGPDYCMKRDDYSDVVVDVTKLRGA